MKTLIAKQGRFVGGLLGIASAFMLYGGYKSAGAVLAVCSIALAIVAERLRKSGN
jgi:hypothetical protein